VSSGYGLVRKKCAGEERERGRGGTRVRKGVFYYVTVKTSRPTLLESGLGNASGCLEKMIE
jgi:hypothetical protein